MQGALMRRTVVGGRGAQPVGLRRWLTIVCFLFFGAAQASYGALSLAVEINPDPVKELDVLDVEIRITSTTATADLCMGVLWPEELKGVPFITGGGGCFGGGCETGEHLFWDLGNLVAGETLALSFSVQTDPFEGNVFEVETEIKEVVDCDDIDDHFANGVSLVKVTPDVEILNDELLEITVDPLSDPVPSGSALIYEVVYGNTAAVSSLGSELSFPIPAGTTFDSATGGGVFSGGVVTWNLGEIHPSLGGRERVTVMVDALADNSLLDVEHAEITGTIDGTPAESRAEAVSRVGPSDLQLAIELNPNPVATKERFDGQIALSNLGGATTGTLTAKLTWPESVKNVPVVGEGGTCFGGGCDPGERLTWDVGTLAPGETQTLSFNQQAAAIAVIPEGRLIHFEVEILEDDAPAVNLSHTLRAQTNSPTQENHPRKLTLAVDPLSDPVAPGGALTYQLTYGNTDSSDAIGAKLVFPLPVGTTFQSATGDWELVDGVVTWEPGSVLGPGIIPAGGGGREMVSVSVDALAENSLLVLDAATLSAETDLIPVKADAMAVSRVATQALGLSTDVVPNPIQDCSPGGNDCMQAEVTVSNPTGSTMSDLSVRVIYPRMLGTVPTTTFGGDCVGTGCDTGEFLVWDLDPLGPGESRPLAFEVLLINPRDGFLFHLEFELHDGSTPVRTLSDTILVHPFVDTDSDGMADVYDEDDDGDGMPDWWEREHGLDPLDPTDADEDPDMDGYTNLEEYLQGSDPNVFTPIFEDGFESGDTSAWSATVQ